jgi:putative tricarboxylic transport membrane protein
VNRGAGLGEQGRDRLLALGVAVFAASYVAAARGIEDSLLSDAVGAGGVPQAVGVALMVAAVALFAKSFLARRAQAADAPAKPANAGRATALRSAALVAILLIYGALLPWLGYPLSISLLVGACGWLAGAAPRVPLLLCAVFSGPGLWLLFDRLLQVRMPLGTLWD